MTSLTGLEIEDLEMFVYLVIVCTTGQLSVRRPYVCLCGVNIFKTLRLLDRWADVDDIWQVYSMGLGIQLL